MATFSRIGSCTVLAGLCVLAGTCGGDEHLNTPSPLTPVTITSVNVEGPARLAPGESAQYTATINLSNFVTKLPTNVRWIASPPSFLKVDAAGVATGGPFSGGAAVTAEVRLPDGKTVQRSLGVTVVPQNTFLMLGTVTDADLPTLIVPNARVELTSGQLVSTTDGSGFYRLFGVPLSYEIRVSAPGYETHTQTFEAAADFRHDFRLRLANPRLNLAGNYTLTIDATACSVFSPPQLNSSLRVRQYDATITQSVVALQVTLTEPRFFVLGGAGNRFSGQVNATGASFNLPWNGDDGVHPSVVERVPDGTVLVSTGSVETTGSAAGLSGTLGGGLFHYGAGFPNQNYLGGCNSPRFTLTPR
jgi:hypothetical protein